MESGVRRGALVQFQGETGRWSGSSRLSMDACSTMTMGLLAVGLGGTLMDTTVKTENGAKRNSISPLTSLFSTKFTCLHRCLPTSSTAAAAAAAAPASHLSDFSPLGIHTNNPVHRRETGVEGHEPEPAQQLRVVQ